MKTKHIGLTLIELIVVIFILLVLLFFLPSISIDRKKENARKLLCFCKNNNGIYLEQTGVFDNYCLDIYNTTSKRSFSGFSYHSSCSISQNEYGYTIRFSEDLPDKFLKPFDIIDCGGNLFSVSKDNFIEDGFLLKGNDINVQFINDNGQIITNKSKYKIHRRPSKHISSIEISGGYCIDFNCSGWTINQEIYKLTNTKIVFIDFSQRRIYLNNTIASDYDSVFLCIKDIKETDNLNKHEIFILIDEHKIRYSKNIKGL